MHCLKSFYLLFILIFSCLKMNAQVCNGTLGDPVINIDFGDGSNNFGPPVAETNYIYQASSPSDGEYTVVKTSAGLNGGWHQNIVGHTTTNNGYFMLVNASNVKGIFYQKNISGLCPNTTYEFAAWIVNILKNPGIKPNIKFTIENNATVIKEFTTGNINEGLPTDWIKYGTVFTTPNIVGTITLKMTNENPGGIGNDLALDDITFSPCGPTIGTEINKSGVAEICVGQSANFNLSASVSAGYNDPVYQWQEFKNGNWIDLPGMTSLQTSVSITNALLGQYRYRILVAERNNIASINCRIAGTPVLVITNNLPIGTASNSGAACVGANVQLAVNGGVSFNWTGPNGFSSTLQNPTLNNVNANSQGTYTVTFQNSAGCSGTAQTVVQILPEIIASTNITAAEICENSSIALSANGGTSYSWQPTTGLSDPNIANPTASPTTTTTYTVTIANATCTTTKTVTLTVLKNVTANAGNDNTIVNGQTITLKGTVSGDKATYFWTPSSYLDNPNQLNPKANPPTNITYTLNVQSGCNTSTDDVLISVYPKIEIPNTFSPNGDGINDNWNIPAIYSFPKIKLKVMNRQGQIVYETITPKPWDGKLKGKDLPVGIYYYQLYIEEREEFYTGWVMITR